MTKAITTLVLSLIVGCGDNHKQLNSTHDASTDSYLLDGERIPVDSVSTDSQVTDAAAVDSQKPAIVSCKSRISINGNNATVSTVITCVGDLNIELTTKAFSSDDMLIASVPQKVNCDDTAGLILKERSQIARIEVTFDVDQIDEFGTCQQVP